MYLSSYIFKYIYKNFIRRFPNTKFYYNKPIFDFLHRHIHYLLSRSCHGYNTKWVDEYLFFKCRKYFVMYECI